ncbi:hypothetical protein ABQE28_11270, partial [Enterococcus durans]
MKKEIETKSRLDSRKIEEKTSNTLFVLLVFYGSLRALCQMMLVKRNLRIIWTEQKEETLF